MNTIKITIYALLAFFAPIKPLILLVLLAIAIDTYFGIKASRRLGKPLISRKFARILDKGFKYIAILALFYGIDFYILNIIFMKWLSIPFFISKFTAFIIICVEGFSVDEKIKSYNNGNGLWFLVKKMLKVAKDTTSEIKDLKEDIEETLETKKEDETN